MWTANKEHFKWTAAWKSWLILNKFQYCQWVCLKIGYLWYLRIHWFNFIIIMFPIGHSDPFGYTPFSDTKWMTARLGCRERMKQAFWRLQEYEWFVAMLVWLNATALWVNPRPAESANMECTCSGWEFETPEQLQETETNPYEMNSTSDFDMSGNPRSNLWLWSWGWKHGGNTLAAYSCL